MEICISKDSKYVNIILFPNYEDTEIYLHENLTYKIFSKFLFDSQGKYLEFVPNHLQIRNGKLWILGFHGQK